MKLYKSDNIRNVAILGHGGTGKTTLIESILYNLKLTKRIGKVEDGSTASDYTKEEKNRGFSISSSLIPVEWNNSKINIIDTPGYFDFVSETFGALRVCGGSVIVVDASAGIEVGTEKAWTYTEKRNMPRVIFINKMDKEDVNYVKIIRDLKEKFGKKIAPFVIPLGKEVGFDGFINVVDLVARKYDGQVCVDCEIPEDYKAKISPVRDLLIEAVAESDEELLDKYFEGEEFTQEEIHKGLRKGVVSGDIVPVLLGSAVEGLGVHTLLNVLVDYMPTPKDMHNAGYEGTLPSETKIEVRNVNEDEPFSALVFKTIVDPFVGKISLFKVISGFVKKDMEILNANKGTVSKVGSVFSLRGKEQVEEEKIVAGDIGAIAKLDDVESGDTICDKNNPIEYEGIKFPRPGLFKAIEPKSKGDEDKIGTALQKLNEEDPSFSINRNKETHQLIIGGQGVMHLSVIINKLKEMFDVEVEMVPQRIAYRETIKGIATVQGKHKKQSGGAGQYGDVHIKFEPYADGFVFEEKIFGGSVPKSYIPAVEKGLEESLDKGPLAGYKVVNLKATLLDGSYHAVDSSEMAFKIAASIAFKKGVTQAQPVLLEPIMHLEISVPDENMGDILGDINRRRGRVLGMEPGQKGYQKVIAEAPEAELFSYSSDLRSMTQARAYFAVRFERYEEVPAAMAGKIIAQAENNSSDRD